MEWTPDDQRDFRKFKAALTRAQNRKDWPAVIRCADKFEEFFNARGIFPDDWTRWTRAKDDAIFEMERAGFSTR
jgi:hypothetical protein